MKTYIRTETGFKVVGTVREGPAALQSMESDLKMEDFTKRRRKTTLDG